MKARKSVVRALRGMAALGAVTATGLSPWSGRMAQAQGHQYSVTIVNQARPVTQGYGISNNGHATGWFADGRDILYRSPAGAVLNLGRGEGERVNDSGQVVGLYTGGSTGSRGFVWTNSGGMTLIPTIATQRSDKSGTARAINNAGQVVGTSNVDPDIYGQETGGAYLYQGGSLTPLVALAYGKQSGAYGINNNGQIVGMAVSSSNWVRAVLWQNGTIQDLGALPGVTENPPPYGWATFTSWASDINDLGQVVGRARSTSGSDKVFLWSAATGMQELPMSPGGNHNWAAINNSGQVVAGMNIWTASQGVRNLNSLIPPGIIQFIYAEDINENGQIVGMGIYYADQGTPRAVILTPVP